MSDWTVEDARQAAARELRRYANTLAPTETLESLLARLDEIRAYVAAQERRALQYRAERDEVRGELARLRVLMRAATATPREHWLGGDHSNQTPQDGKTLTDEERSVAYHDGWNAGHYAVKPASPTLIPVGEHPEPGTRGLLPVRVDVDNDWSYGEGFSTLLCDTRSETGRTILTDPRTGGGAQ